MIKLLLQLSWFLFTLSLLLLLAVPMSLMLRKKKPGVAKWSAWISLGVSCVAVCVVILTTGHLSMIMRRENIYGNPCNTFNKSEFSETSNHQDQNPRVSLFSWYWSIFTNKFPALELWTRWIALGLCLGAVVSFVIVITVASRDDGKNGLRRKMKMNTELFNKLVKKEPLAPYSKIKSKISYIGMGAVAAPKHHRIKHKVSLREVWAVYAALGLFAAAVIGAVILNHSIGNGRGNDGRPTLWPDDCDTFGLEGSDIHSSIDPYDDCKLLADHPLIVSREEWMAIPPTPTRVLPSPVVRVVISLTGRGSCLSLESCINAIRQIKFSNMNPMNGTWDISDNFIVAGDGRIYEGRGWDVLEDNTSFYQRESLGVRFMGTYRDYLPPSQQLKAFNDLIREGLRLGKIAEDYELVAEPKSKRSLLYRVLKTWNHSHLFL